MGVYEHDLGDRTLIEAAGKAALAQAQLDLILRLTIATLCDPNQNALACAEEWETRDLCSELSSQFRARCKDPSLRTKLRAVLLECERLSNERGRLLSTAWTVAKNAAAREGEPLLVSEPTAAALGRLATQINALARVIDNARQRGFIAKTAAEETAPPVLAARIATGPHASANALAVIRLPEPQPAKARIETPALVLHGQLAMLQPPGSERLATMVCPNCQMKVVST